MAVDLLIGGLDISPTQTGYCAPNGTMHTIRPAAKSRDRGRQLSQSREQLTRAIRLHPPLPTLMVVEEYMLSTRKLSFLCQVGEVGGAMKLVMFDLGIGFVTVHANTLKKFATGKGNADKPMMMEFARNRILCGDASARVPSNWDEADAWHLRQMGRVALGVDKPWAEWQWDAIQNCAVTW